MATNKITLYMVILGLITIGVSICSAQNTQHNAISDYKYAYSEGNKAFDKGDYVTAVKNWETCLFLFSNDLKDLPDKKKYIENLYLDIGEAYRFLAQKEAPEESEFFNKALSYYQRIDTFGEGGIIEDVVNLSLYYLYSDRGRRFRYKGMYNKAKPYHEKSLNLTRKYLPDTIRIPNNTIKRAKLEARELRDLGATEKYLANYERSIKYFEGALKLWKELKEEKEILLERGNIALLQMDMGELAKAKENFLSLIKDYGDDSNLHLGDVYINIGKWHFILGNYGDAEVYFQKAEKIYRKLNDNRRINLLLIWRGLIAYNKGLYFKALSFFEKVYASKDIDFTDIRLQAKALSNAGIVYLYLFRENQKKADLEMAQKECFLKAQKIARDVEDKKMLMRTTANLAITFYEYACFSRAKGNEREAEDNFQKADKSFADAHKLALELSNTKTLSLYEISQISSDWGDVYLKKKGHGNIKIAIKKYNDALRCARGLNLDQIWYAYYGLARAYELQKNFDEAIKNYKLSIDVIEKMRKLMSGSGRIGFLRNKQQVYTGLINLLLSRWEKEKNSSKKQRYSIEALRYLERSRLGAIRNLFEQALPEKKGKIKEKLIEVNTKLSNPIYNKEFTRLKKEKDKLEKTLEQDDSLISRQQINEDTLRQVISNMDSRQVMLEFYYNDDNIYVWKYDKKLKQPFLLKPIKRRFGRLREDLIEDYIVRLYRKLSDNTILFDEEETEVLKLIITVSHDQLFLPLDIESQYYKYITIIPYGKISLIPFSVLGYENHKLIDQYVFNYYFSAIQQLEVKDKVSDQKLLAIGNPDIPDYMNRLLKINTSAVRGVAKGTSNNNKNNINIKFKEALDIISRLNIEREPNAGDAVRSLGFNQLKEAGDEVRQIKNQFEERQKVSDNHHFQSKLYIDEKVPENIIKKELLKNYNCIHFATHGQLVSENPLDSFLVFSEGDPNVSQFDSGLLTVKEIRENFFGELKTVRLAVLSACQTSLALSSEELQGATGLEFATLAGAFQSAGVKTVIASLWSVSSEATALLMKRFYYYMIAENKSIAEALQLSQKEFRDKNCKLTLNIIKNGKKEKIETGCDKEYFWSPFIVLGNPK